MSRMVRLEEDTASALAELKFKMKVTSYDAVVKRLLKERRA